MSQIAEPFAPQKNAELPRQEVQSEALAADPQAPPSVAVFPTPHVDHALDVAPSGEAFAAYSALERARPDLHGSVIFDQALKILHISKPLDAVLALGSSALSTAVLRPDHDRNQPHNVLGFITSLLEGGYGSADVRFRNWLEGAMAGTSAEHLAPLRVELPPQRTLELKLSRIGEACWAISIEELSAAPHKGMFAVLFQDRLTGAANRALFEHKLDVALQALHSGVEDSVTVLFLDLDRFKAVNDTLGHGVGDALLGLVGERLRAGLRDSDVLARLGGDEFAILLRQGIDQQRISELANRLIDLVRRPYLVNGHVINIGASIGAACAPEDGRSRDQLLRSADLALYHSKSAGRGVFHFFAASMEERAQQRRAMELDLRKALVLKQFELHYQPQIDVEKQTVIGLEGLLRWRHPQRGMLLPAEFLPFAEEIGLAIPIGNWVLRTACKDAMSLPDSMTVAVNVSPVQFESAEFAFSAASALKAANLPGHRLEIEVTEEILLRDGENVRATLESLRQMGVRVAMDSFGTGLASLSQVVNFPFHKIKIDRSLIGGTENDAKSRAILRAVSALGQSLGIATLAEGVETPEHLAHVRAEGCHSVQGFYYSRAVPATELLAVLEGFAANTDTRNEWSSDGTSSFPHPLLQPQSHSPKPRVGNLRSQPNIPHGTFEQQPS